MKKEYILFIDSGIGGLSTLAQTYKMVNFNYIYCADNANSPYGMHSKRDLNEFLSILINKITKIHKVIMIILACNTATACCVNQLRAKFKDIPIVGTEPAVFLASKLGYQHILSLTTPATAKQKRYNKLKNKSSANIKTLSMPDFATNIENYELSKNIKNYFYLAKNLFNIKHHAAKYDCVVLGCTHYVFIKNILTNFAKKPMVDGNLGVAKQVAKLLKQIGIKQTKTSTVKYYFSSDANKPTENYKKIFSQILAKV